MERKFISFHSLFSIKKNVELCSASHSTFSEPCQPNINRCEMRRTAFFSISMQKTVLFQRNMKQFFGEQIIKYVSSVYPQDAWRQNPLTCSIFMLSKKPSLANVNNKFWREAGVKKSRIEWKKNSKQPKKNVFIYHNCSLISSESVQHLRATECFGLFGLETSLKKNKSFFDQNLRHPWSPHSQNIRVNPH